MTRLSSPVLRKTLFIVLVSLFIASCSREPGGRGAPPASPESPVFAVNTTQALRGSIDDYLAVSGDIVARSTIEAYPDTAGRVSRVMVKTGQRVSKGEALVEIDPNRPGMNFAIAVVPSPISGTVVSVPVQPGQLVSQQLSVARIAQTDELDLRTWVAERFVSRVRVGQKAQVSLDAWPGQVFTATVRETSPVLDPASRTLELKLSFDRADPRLKAGMFAKIKLITESKDNIVKIPATAVVRRFGKTWVFVVKEDSERAGGYLVERRDIVPGILIDDSLEVENGLAAGDEIVIRGQTLLEDGADSPMIFKFDPSMIPIMGFMISGNRSPEELNEIADRTIVPRIEQVPGVSMASISGGRAKIIRVDIPRDRLEAYGLTITQITQILRAQNAQVAAGSISDQGLSWLLTSAGEYQSIEEIKSTAIAYKGGGFQGGVMEPARQILLRDIADVYEGYRAESSLVYVDGVPAIQISVQKQSGKNSVQTGQALRRQVEEIKKDLPEGVFMEETFNTTDIIENSIKQVASSAIIGALLAVIILLVFLRSIKSTLIIGITIPVSLLLTLMFMYFAGLTLNIMTLAGLALGVGMLVDNSIVILENIYRYREKGAKLTVSAILGAKEMYMPIVASTLTTICVFAPLVMFKSELEIIGELFAGLAFTVVISLATSLVVAIVLIPVLASHYLPITTRKQKALSGFLAVLDRPFGSFFKGLDRAYRAGVSFALKHRALTLVSIIVFFFASFLLVPRIGFVFMPSQPGDSVSLSVDLPLGSALSETEAVLNRLEAIVRRDIKGVERITLSAGESGMMGSTTSPHRGSLRINLPPFEERVETSDEIQTLLRSHFNTFPGVRFSLSASGGMMMGMGSPVDVVIKTGDLVKGKEVAERIAELLREIPDVTEPRVSIADGLPQVEMRLDRERMYALGLNAYTIGQELKAAVDGVTATRYRSGGSEYDVVLMLAEADRESLPDLEQLFVMSPQGQRVPFSSFAHYEKTSGPVAISREDQGRVIHVTAGTAPFVPINRVEAQVRSSIALNIPADDEILISFSGDYQETMNYIPKLLMILMVAVFLVFGIMASQFESFIDPFIIVLAIPLSITGILWIYFLSGEMLNVLSAVGLLVLVGIIVNNGIVLVDYTNTLRKRGLPLMTACIEAAVSRLRPILMTTLTTLLALIPMAFFPGEGAELVAPIGKAVLGGLSFGTLMTLFLMPVLYSLFNRKSDERRARAEARREAIAAGRKNFGKRSLGGIPHETT